VQVLQMSFVLFYFSKLLKVGKRYGNMKLVTVRAVQVTGGGGGGVRQTPCSGPGSGMGQGFRGPRGTPQP